MQTTVSTLAWEISWTGEPGGLQSIRKRVDTPLRLNSSSVAAPIALLALPCSECALTGYISVTPCF